LMSVNALLVNLDGSATMSLILESSVSDLIARTQRL
jgi:hypothetical protein